MFGFHQRQRQQTGRKWASAIATMVFAAMLSLNFSIRGQYQKTPIAATAFSVGFHSSSRKDLALLASSRGMGMGMGSSTTKRNAPTKKSRSKKDSPSAPFDVSASLLRHEKRYDELLRDATKRLQKEEDEHDDDIVTTEYMIAARDKTKKIISDWVPVAQLCLARTWKDAHASEGSSDRTVQAALSSYCREIHHVAGLGSRVFPSIPRNNLEYSVEPIESFHKFVYDAVVEPDNKKSSNDGTKMSHQEARTVLKITETRDLSLSDLKSQYRRRSFEYHPDRLAQRQDLTDEEREGAQDEYSKVKLAYETLIGSGWARKDGVSWYESLGGRGRTDFVGPVQLLPIQTAEAEIKSCKCAIVGLDPSMVQTFVTRTQQLA